MKKNDAIYRWYWQLVLAGTLLTRLPLPRLPPRFLNQHAQCAWAYPLIGFCIALFSCLTGLCALALELPAPIAAGLMLCTSILLTGAMHEDGLADCADGFWGGFDPVQRLKIMKDSQIGTYGVLALLLITGLRWFSLGLLVTSDLPAVFTAAILSRGVLPLIMARQKHARASGLSYTVGRPGLRIALTAFLLASCGALLFSGAAAFGAILLSGLTALLLSCLARNKIGGQTGDVLGATQILTETGLLLYFIT